MFGSVEADEVYIAKDDNFEGYGAKKDPPKRASRTSVCSLRWLCVKDRGGWSLRLLAKLSVAGMNLF
jgi:hypothetical protein